MKCSRLAWGCFLLLVLRGATADDMPPAQTIPSPLSPRDSLRYLQVHPALRVELAACEPQVVDPIALRFDEQGRMWVVEMRDYPHGPAPGETPRSRIVVLTDTDADGFFETAEVFADGLLFVTGIQPWKGGVFVTLAGKLDYMRDTDGDGRADVVETWFTGFAEENSQLRANHPRLGLDQHIYVANGLRGGMVRDARRPDSQPPVSLRGMDFRFEPHSGRYEAISGNGQFGLTMDDFGRRFVCSNRNPLMHVVLEDRYVRLNPRVPIPAVVHDVAAAGEQSRLFPLSRNWTTSNLHAGQFTAACGVTIYRGDALPAEFRGNGFTCDPTGNLVHREIVQPQGPTFAGRPARPSVEFLASPDEWFRPVNLESGPDGALYVVDMYRAVIEHPQFMPEELKNRPDLLWGNDRGRIYRVVAQDAPSTGRPTDLPLDALSSEQLVALLAHSNAWHRETAARLLYERQDASVRQALEQLAGSGPHPPARAAALWALQGLGCLDEPTLLNALRDPDASVREQAYVLCEHLADPSPAVRQAAQQDERDPRAAFQQILSLARMDAATWGAEGLLSRLGAMAVRHSEDIWMRRAVLLAAGSQAGPLVLRIAESLQQPPTEGNGPLQWMVDLAAAAGADPSDLAPRALLEDDRWAALDRAGTAARLAVLKGLADGLLRAKRSLATLLPQLPPRARDRAQATLRDARRLAAAAGQPAALRLLAIDLLAHDLSAADTLAPLALGDGEQAIRIRAVAALAQQAGHLEVWRQLLEQFSSQTPAVRSAVLDAVLARQERVALLLDALSHKHIRAGELDRARTTRLLNQTDADLRQRAQRLLAEAVPADRQQVLADYRRALELPADPLRGREVFRKNCATCHRIADIGVNVAPDIADSRTKQPEQLLTDILQPNRAIDNNYISYTVITVDGRSLTGIVAAEGSTSVTLRQPEGKSITLLRSEIDQMQSNGISLMPEGLEKNIPHQEMADLIAFIKNWRYLDGRTPLAQPMPPQAGNR
jgi:putative membrane-bound dehydrogenase-like protein